MTAKQDARPKADAPKDGAKQAPLNSLRQIRCRFQLEKRNKRRIHELAVVVDVEAAYPLLARLAEIAEEPTFVDRIHNNDQIGPVDVRALDLLVGIGSQDRRVRLEVRLIRKYLLSSRAAASDAAEEEQGRSGPDSVSALRPSLRISPLRTRPGEACGRYPRGRFGGPYRVDVLSRF
jgi:hypothetical protein